MDAHPAALRYIAPRIPPAQAARLHAFVCRSQALRKGGDGCRPLGEVQALRVAAMEVERTCPARELGQLRAGLTLLGGAAEVLRTGRPQPLADSRLLAAPLPEYHTAKILECCRMYYCAPLVQAPAPLLIKDAPVQGKPTMAGQVAKHKILARGPAATPVALGIVDAGRTA